MRRAFFIVFLTLGYFFLGLAQNDTVLLNHIQIKKPTPPDAVNASYFTKYPPKPIHTWRSKSIKTYPYQYLRDEFISLFQEKEEIIRGRREGERDVYFHNLVVLPHDKVKLILTTYFPRYPSGSAFLDIETVKNRKRRSQINSLNLISQDEGGAHIYGQIMILDNGMTILYSSYLIAPQNQYQRIDIYYRINKRARLVKQKIVVYKPQHYPNNWFYTKNIWDGNEAIDDVLIGKNIKKYDYVGNVSD